MLKVIGIALAFGLVSLLGAVIGIAIFILVELSLSGDPL